MVGKQGLGVQSLNPDFTEVLLLFLFWVSIYLASIKDHLNATLAS